MEEGRMSGTYVFRGIEYVVTMIVESDSLVVEVEDRLTADQWRGTFDTAYIEDLTHKTGNYKQFGIFVSMLESALSQSSDSVTLDLLTYSDLQSLRNRKAGVGTKAAPGARAAGLNSKRYLILTYTVEFDRIHYPLPLPYMGKPDPRSLQENIRQLRQEIKMLKHSGGKDFRNKELEKLRRDFDHLMQAKEELESEFLLYKREVQHTSQGSAAKEVRILKSIVKNLEEELVEEKTKYQRGASKRNQEYRQLLDEVDELRASERNLKVRVKSLTNELSLYKSGRMAGRANVSAASSRVSARSHHSSRDSSRRDHSYLSDRPSHTNRSNSRENFRERSNSRERLHERSNSRDRMRNRSNSGDRLTDRAPSRLHTRSRSGSFGERTGRCRSNSSERGRNRTPSPSGFPRFNPTAFVKEKQRKSQESELKKKRQTRGKMNGSQDKKSRPSPLSERNYSRNRSSSFGSMRSRTSSLESLTDVGLASDSSTGINRKSKKTSRSRHHLSAGFSSPDVSFTKRRPSKENILASTPEGKKHKPRKVTRGKENDPSDVADSDYYDRSTEISEIDARLNRLQKFMKTTMP